MKKNKNYTLKPTKKQLESIKEYWKFLKEAEFQFYKSVNFIEEDMRKVTGIKDLEFFMCDNEYVGIGNESRTMELLQKEDLEK